VDSRLWFGICSRWWKAPSILAKPDRRSRGSGGAGSRLTAEELESHPGTRSAVTIGGSELSGLASAPQRACWAVRLRPAPWVLRYRVVSPATQPLAGASHHHGWRRAERQGVRGVVVRSVCSSLHVGCRSQFGFFGAWAGGSRSVATKSKAFHGAEMESSQACRSIRPVGSVGVSGWLHWELRCEEHPGPRRTLAKAGLGP
jgi:hypothetical protein